MSDAVWIAPSDALRSNREGALPMVFPTIKTLLALEAQATPIDALASFRGREIPTIMPRLVSTPTGVGIEVDPERAS
jgi:hypothetical protein